MPGPYASRHEAPSEGSSLFGKTPARIRWRGLACRIKLTKMTKLTKDYDVPVLASGVIVVILFGISARRS